MRHAFAVVLLLLALVAGAQQAPSPAPEPAKPAAAPAARIADAAWLVGYWAGEGLGGEVEDVWLPPRAGVLLGAFRLVGADGKPGFYELFAIEEVDDTLQFVVKHFNPDWVGWEEKDKALRIRLTRLSRDEMAFGSIVFRRAGADGLVVEIAIRRKDGTLRHETLTFRRKAL